MSTPLRCRHFDRDECRSCTLLPQPYDQQLIDKTAQIRAQLKLPPSTHWLPSLPSPETGMRNKAKLVVGGSIENPTLGIADSDGRGVDLADCLLYPHAITASFPALKALIREAHVQPYDVPGRRGELKFLQLTHAAHSGELMLRIVLRSREALTRIRKHLPQLQARLPWLRVVSVNLHPEHKAVLAGEEEIFLTRQHHLSMCINDVTMRIGPASFFQTNDSVAAGLYQQVRQWCAQIAPLSVWDLYCGVGGFALHCADGERVVRGIESNAEAITCATASAKEAGEQRLQFICADATTFVAAQADCAEMIIVNPPRRGLGLELCALLDRSSARWLIYSSCNAASLGTDLARMQNFIPQQARVLDMFPHTKHAEVALLLARVAVSP